MIVSIHQPHYWPWLGLLDKIAKSDIFVILDDVVINKRSNQRRNLFFCNGKKKYLTLAAKYSDSSLINQVLLENQSQHLSDLKLLKQWYSKSKYFNEIIDFINTQNIFKKSYLNISELNIDTIKVLCRLFDIKAEIKIASQIDYKGYKSDLNLSICEKVNATTYLSGQGAKGYMVKNDYEKFENSHIKIEFQSFCHPQYSQNTNFIEGLSALDMLFWNGIEKSRELFWENIKKCKE